MTEMTPDVVRGCWRDGTDPETITLGKFCHWCHHKKPKHDLECPVLEVVANRTHIEALESRLGMAISILGDTRHFREAVVIDGWCQRRDLFLAENDLAAKKEKP